MYRKIYTVLVFQLFTLAAFSQENPGDTSLSRSNAEATDTTIDYDELLKEFESFLDSISSPKSFFVGSVSLGRGYFNFSSKSSVLLESTQKFTYSPNLGYYHKSGFGITGIGYLVNDEDKMNFFQVALSPSYDYLSNHKFATGFAYTRFFTKDSLNFYTSPLQNEVYAYFTYRDWWLKPSVALSYGWGSRSEYEEREELITSLQLRRNGYVRINTKESISDFTIMTSLRHDFYWLDIFAYDDHIRFTPQIMLTSGTQNFGFNQSSNTYATNIRTGNNILYNSESYYLDDNLEFQPLSATLFLRGEYSIGRFFFQPQVVLDYYFPVPEKNFNTLFSITTGFIF